MTLPTRLFRLPGDGLPAAPMISWTDARTAVNYTSANAIQPEWQNRQPGKGIIQDTLKWEQIEPCRWRWRWPRWA